MEQVLGEKWPWGPCNGGDQAQDVHQEDDVQIGKTVAGAFSPFHLASSRTAHMTHQNEPCNSAKVGTASHFASRAQKRPGTAISPKPSILNLSNRTLSHPQVSFCSVSTFSMDMVHQLEKPSFLKYLGHPRSYISPRHLKSPHPPKSLGSISFMGA